MYRGYSISKKEIEDFFEKIGRKNGDYIEFFYKDQKKTVEKNMKNILQIMEKEVLDAKKIQDDWFPEINTHVFISHSHDDIELAKNLAGWLYLRFGIESFIDSCVWGYADDLLKIIDFKYCKNPTGNTYNYKKRNFSTAHIHMMLMSALNKMIYKSECVFFLNTPNSNVGEGIKSETLSPWIYGEIEFSRTIHKEIPIRCKKFSTGGALDESKKKLQMGHPLNLDHFYSLSYEDLSTWKERPINPNKPLDALDELYKITPTKEIM